MTKKVLLCMLAVLVLALASCSPTAKGKKIAKKFCSELKNYKDLTDPADFQKKKNYAEMVIMPDMAKVQEKYMHDPLKMMEFEAAFSKTIDKKGAKFIAAYQEAIHARLDNQVWFLSKDKNNFFLYEFTHDSVNMINCKTPVAYTMHFDTLCFECGTHALVTFTGDSSMTVSNAYYPSQCADYTIATQRDMLAGPWKWTSSEGGWGTCTLYGGGGLYWYNSSHRRSWSHISWWCRPKKDGDGYSFCWDRRVGTLNVTDRDHFKSSGRTTETFTRNPKDTPKSMGCLFNVKD